MNLYYLTAFVGADGLPSIVQIFTIMICLRDPARKRIESGTINQVNEVVRGNQLSNN